MSDYVKARWPSLELLGLIAAVVLQACGLVWWGAHIDQRMTAVEERVAVMASTRETIARLDERTAGLVTTVDRIDQRLNAQSDSRKP